MKLTPRWGDGLGDLALASFFPTVLLLSIPLELFAGNREEFPVSVLTPYWLAAGAVLAVLLLLAVLLPPRGRGLMSRMLFFLALFIYLSQVLVPPRMSSLIGLENQATVYEPLSAALLQLLLLVLLACGCIWLPRKFLRGAGIPLALGILAVLLVRSAAVAGGSGQARSHAPEPVSYPAPRAARANGNIYRLLLDCFGSRGFARVYPGGGQRTSLPDFIFYPENRSNYLWTQPSVVCCKTGSFFKGGNLREWIERGSTPTTARRLREAGWIVSSYGGPRMMKKEPAHRHVSTTDVDNQKQSSREQLQRHLQFADLCLLRLAPVPWRQEVYGGGHGLLSRRFAAAETFLGPHLRVETALRLFRTLLEDEKSRPDAGHYVEAHIRLPHPPFVLDGALAYHPQGTTHDDQMQAAMSLIAQFVAELKRLGRYDNALIIIHSDHGSSQEKDDPPPAETGLTAPVVSRINAMTKRPGMNARKLDRVSRALLLLKPARHSAPKLRISPWETQTADIAATILSHAGLAEMTAEGFSLLGDSFPVRRQIHIFEGFLRPGNILATRPPRCEMNHFSFRKGVGWEIHPPVQVVNR